MRGSERQERPGRQNSPFECEESPEVRTQESFCQKILIEDHRCLCHGSAQQEEEGVTLSPESTCQQVEQLRKTGCFVTNGK